MCGFAGFITTSAQRRRDELCSAVHAMAETLRHRGPDDAGMWLDETAGVALGFRRLAILDLSQAGHQPMVSGDGRLVITFNGEIYNHSDLRADLSASGRHGAWSGHSDTETLLAGFSAWGVKATLERAVGMFAFALWDRNDRRLYLARDRFGEKPLYYGWTARGFVFGSELKALRRYPGFDNPIDADALGAYMQYCYVPTPYSIYRNIYKLEPGCLLSLSPEHAAIPPSEPMFAPIQQPGMSLEAYWSLREAVERGFASQIHDEHDALDALERAMADAVRLQSIADVPLGAFLSGGIDSSLIAALMQAQSARRVRTFTIGFEEAGFNEAEHAKAVARHLGTDHTELYVSAAQTRDVIPRLPQLYSEPFADSSQVPTHVVSQVARQHVTVALSGDGGDELFGGYTRYLWAPKIWNGVKWLPASVRRGVGAAIQRVPVSTIDTLSAVAPGLSGTARVGDKAHKLADRVAGVGGIEALYRSLVRTWSPGADVVRGARPLVTPLDRAAAWHPTADPEHRMMFWDTLTYLPDDILHKVDRASMGVSLETRAPFLDHRVAELAWRLPLHMKIRDDRGKWIGRQLLYRYVPRDLVERPKMGFAIPLDAWLRGPLREWADTLLAESRMRVQGHLNPAVIRRKWTEHLSGTRNWQNELWCVLMFQAWHDEAAENA
jgi:asparagine synthase (glutamine-hydrolysing)